MNGAVISDCGKYRYSLTRTVPGAESKTRMTVIMCNPSTADATRDDPTIRKLYGFARHLDVGHITVVNVYAYRATDPKELKRTELPQGPWDLARPEAVAP